MRPGDVIDGRFELLRLAGAGGMGSVFEAKDLGRGVRVALKSMRGDALEQARFAREAEALARLSHPGIVGYVAHGRARGAAGAEGELYLAMEWLEGEDLHARLASGPLSAEETLELGARVAEALGAAHRAGVVHRDIKPSNLFLPEGEIERVKVLDFGLVRFHAASRSFTATGTVMGTPAYMAPEQARGEGNVGPRADVFSLGCVLFECLAGRPPFEGQHAMAILAKVLLEEAPRLHELVARVPPALDDLVARMLSKSPAARPEDGHAVARALLALGTSAAPPRPSSLPPRESVTWPSLGSGEQRLVCVMLVRGLRSAAEALAPPLDAEDDAPTMLRPSLDDAPTHAALAAPPGMLSESATLAQVPSALESLRRLSEAHGGRLEPLADGSLLVVFSGGVATDVAAQAARCALGARASLPGAAIALATGRAAVARGRAVGEAIDRAAELVEGPRAEAGPLVDAATAGLLEARFDVREQSGHFRLLGERAAAALRTVLGRPTPFVGRDAELTLLAQAFEACASGPEARVLLVTAPPGAGKSRLCHELLLRLEGHEARPEVWLAQGASMGAGSPFGMVAQMLRQAAGILEGEPPRVRHDKLRARVARALGTRAAGSDVERVVAFLGEVVQTPGEGDGGAAMRAARHEATRMADQIKLAWVDLLEAETQAKPLVLVLEDLHWGDRPSVEIVDLALQRLEDRPLMVLALARPELHETFPKLWSARRAQKIRLGELGKKASERIVRAVLGSEASAELSARLVEHASGNPFYLEELVRWAAAGGGERLPETVLGMVEARLDRLDPDARRVLRAASVFGQAFWRSGIEAMLGKVEASEADTGVTAHLARLGEQEFVAPAARGSKFAGQEEHVFLHALVREAAYATLTEEDRALGHRLAGAWLENAGEQDALVLAEHFERGKEPERALGWYKRAAEHALEGGDFEAVVERVECAERCGARGELLGELRLLEAKACQWAGNNARGLTAGLDAMRLLPRGTNGWCRAAAEAALTGGRLGDLARLAEVTNALLSASALERPSGAAAAACAAQQWVYAGVWERVEPLVAPLERAAAASSDPELRAWWLRVRTWRAQRTSDYGAYAALLEALVASFAAEGDLRRAAAYRGNLGFALVELGAYEAAETELREALAGARKLGLGNSVAAAKQNLGWALARMGRLEEARRVEEEAVVAFAAQKDVRMEAASRCYLAQALADSGELEDAEREARRAVELLRLTAFSLHASALATLADVLLRRERPAEALAAAEEALDLLRSLGSSDGDVGYIRLILAEALFANGNRGPVPSAILEARAVVLGCAGRISDPARRSSFLEKVPEHARILELAARWGT